MILVIGSPRVTRYHDSESECAPAPRDSRGDAFPQVIDHEPGPAATAQ